MKPEVPKAQVWSEFGGLLRLLSGNGRRLVAVLEAYLDESGMDERAPCVVVGGYVGSGKEWKKFSKEWSAVLAKHAVSVFHAKESKCKRLFEPMYKSIRRRKIKGFVCVINKDKFKKLVSAEARQLGGNAYAMGVDGVVGGITGWATQKGLGRTALVIESGQPNSAALAARLDKWQTSGRVEVASATLARKDEFVPLQAADFLAHVIATNKGKWPNKVVGDAYGKAMFCLQTDEELAGASESTERYAVQYRRIRQQAKAAKRKAKKIPESSSSAG